MSSHVSEHVQAWWTRVQWHAHAAVGDPDPTHVHLFRTHLRRIRSLAGHLKTLLPDPPAAQVRTTLRSVALRTGQLRDYDVMRQCRENWLAALPPGLAVGGVEVWQQLDLEYQQTRELVTGYLAGDHFRGQRLATDRALPVLFADPDRVLDRALLGAVARQHRKLVKAAGKLTGTTPPERWHRLRIQAKKLRYGLEACAATDARSELLALLKGLQKALGDVNDLAVQSLLLDELGDRDWSPVAYQALGGWRLWLQGRQGQQLPRLPEALQVYAGKRADRLIDGITRGGG